MNIWNQIPFLRLLLPFLAGILSAIYSRKEFEVFNYLIIGLVACYSLFVFFKGLNANYRYAWANGVLITCILFLSGFQLTVLKTDKYKPEHFSNCEADLYQVKTVSTTLEKEKSYKVTVEVLAARKDGQWTQTSGKAMCYFKKDSAASHLRYGDCLILKTNFNEVRPPQNPGEFNYKQFLSFHNIYHQAYLPSENWMSLGVNEGNTIISASYSLREYLLNIYRANGISGDEFAVGSALVLGYTDELDQDIISAYASSGALHVLSVSGLHVGIIYIIFNYLLFFLDKFKHGAAIKAILLLIILWFYATLTGLSPSVLRSAAMFSFIVIAKAWRYNTNIFNTLATSCFALLLWNPYLIMEVGFQLSYLAVLGIVAIQPWIYDRWRPTSWLGNQIWMITSVSIAAQIATFPLGLLYFHQFPNYFLFSNLIVIPISTVILGYGLLMFVLGKISAVAVFSAKIFSGLVWFLNESVRFVDQLPGALLEGISISILETWLMYALIILIMIFIYYKQAKYIYLGLTTLILLLSLQTVEARELRRQEALIIYNVPKTSAYDLITGNQTVFLADSALIHNPGRMLFNVKHNWWDRGITGQALIEQESLTAFYNEHVSIRNGFIQFHNKRIAVISEPLSTRVSLQQKLPVDLIIIARNPKIKITDIAKAYEFKKIIFDSSNTTWKIEKWKKECEELKIDTYSVSESGAYVEEI